MLIVQFKSEFSSSCVMTWCFLTETPPWCPTESLMKNQSPPGRRQCSWVSQQSPSGQDRHISGIRHSPRQKIPHQLKYSQNTPSRHVQVKDRRKINRQTCISCQGATLQLRLFVLTFIKLSFPGGGPGRRNLQAWGSPPPVGQCLRTDALALQIQIHRHGHYNPRLEIKKTSF